MSNVGRSGLLKKPNFLVKPGDRMNASHLLVVSHSSGFYGAERSLLMVAAGLVSRGFRLTVVVPGEGRLEDELEKAGVEVIRWKFYGWVGRENRLVKGGCRLLFNSISSLAFLARYRDEFSCVYTNTVVTSFGFFVAAGMKIPHVWHVREFVHEDMNAKFDLPRHVLKRFFNHRLGLAIYNSRALRNKFIHYFGEHNAKIIYNGLKFPTDEPQFRVRGLHHSSTVTLLMVGSLHEGKGHLDAIEALPFVCQKYSETKLIIAGTGDEKYKKRLEERAERLGIRETIRFIGYTENPRDLIGSSDLFLMCSRSEAFGRVTVEAMSVGCPVIGARAGGTSEIIEDGCSGALYESGDPFGLSESILRLLGCTECRVRLSKAGRVRAGQFNEARCVRELSRNLRKVVP